MIFLVLHIVSYVALAVIGAQTVRALDSRSRARQYRALLVRITKLESELGLGVFWAKDALDQFEPMLSRPQTPGYSRLLQYAFRCYGCEEIVVYAEYDQRPKGRVRDDRHLFCNRCLPAQMVVPA